MAMKKLTALLLSAILLLAAFAPVMTAGAAVSGIYTYTLINDKKEVRIDKAPGAAGALIIPAKIADKPVTQIASGAFSGNNKITSVKIPEGVKSIGSFAFEVCEKLKSVTLPSTLTTIGAYAFAFSGLASVTVPAKVTKIGEYAFGSCEALTAATIKSGVKSIPKGCFFGCKKLTGITMPASVKTIGKEAFAACSALASVKLTQSVTTIAADAFAQCAKLKALTVSVTIGVGQNYTLPKYTGTWKDSNGKTAASTTFKGSAVGKTSFSITDKDKRKLTVNVNVKAKPTKIAFKTASATIGVGESFATGVTFTPEKAHTKRTYTSKDPTIATVNSSGKITGKKAGKTTITVKTYNGKTAEFTVTVKKAPGSVKLDKASATLAKGKTLTLAATLPSGTASKLTWSSSKASVAKVDSKGKVTAVAKGTAVITVKTFNGKTAAVTVKVP